MTEEWFTHPSLTEESKEIVFGTPSGPKRCAVTHGVFCRPEGVRLHSSFVRAVPPSEAEEALRRQKIAELREQAARLGLRLPEGWGSAAAAPPPPPEEATGAAGDEAPEQSGTQRPQAQGAVAGAQGAATARPRSGTRRSGPARARGGARRR